VHAPYHESDHVLNIPAQIVKTGRRIIYRLLAYNPSQQLLFRMLAGIGVPT